MIDLKCSQKNLNKLKNESNQFELRELSQNYLINSIDKKRIHLASESFENSYDLNENCDKIDKFKNVQDKTTQILVQSDMQCSNEIKDLNSPRGSNEDLLINLNELDQFKYCSNQTNGNKSKKSNGQSINLNPTSISYATKQEISSHQSTSQAAHSNETHNVHFANQTEKQSAISLGHFSIYLDRLDYEYRPSDVLTGKLHLLLESGQINLRRIVIYLKGISSVKYVKFFY